MAEDIRNSDPQMGLADPRAEHLVRECRRQEEPCLYTSTTLYIWLRQTRLIHGVFVVAPVVLGALATWSVLDRPEQTWVVWFTATCALLAGLFPVIFAALKLDAHVGSIAMQAAVYKKLQDRFRQLAAIDALGPYGAFEAEFREVMGRMDEARAASITPPERCFKAARRKIADGHYCFDAVQNDTEECQGFPAT